MKYEPLHLRLLQAPISGLLCESKESDLHGRNATAPSDSGMTESLLSSFYCFWTIVREKFVLIHVFSVLLLAHETGEIAAEEKYLIYTLEKTLL